MEYASRPGLTRTAASLARERRWIGYRRLLIFQRREGFIVKHKRLFRIYREERLVVRKTPHGAQTEKSLGNKGAHGAQPSSDRRTREPRTALK
jgi:putative transposase